MIAIKPEEVKIEMNHVGMLIGKESYDALAKEKKKHRHG